LCNIFTGGEYHAEMAAGALNQVDAMRRYEFLRRKEVKQVGYKFWL